MVTDEQLAAYLAAEMSDDERAGFEEDVLADDAVRRELLAQRKVSAGLRALLGGGNERITQAILATTRGMSDEAIARRVVAVPARAAERPGVQHLPARVHERPRRSWWIPLAVAMAAVVAWKNFLPSRSNSAAPIAVLTRAADAVWADASFAPQPGSALKPGWLRLKAGAVQVEFSRGARVVVEGPAEFQLVSDNEGRLGFGRLWAHVPPKAHGFTVRARDFTAVDLGTEFGCKVPPDGPAEVHVFGGSVEVRDAAGLQAMRANQALQLATTGSREIPAQRRGFLGEEQMPQRTAFLRGSRTEQDIGAPDRRGSTSLDARTGVWTVAGGGADIYGASDQFHFVAQELAGDGTLIAQVSSLEVTDGYAKAGLMWRESHAPDARYAFVFIGPNTLSYELRSAPAAASIGASYGSGSAPKWLKLTRAGDVFTAFSSDDGVTWTQLGSGRKIPMSATARAGLAVTAHNDAALNRSTFDHVSAQP